MTLVVIIIAASVFAVHLVKDREVEDDGLKVDEYPKPQPIFSSLDMKIFNVEKLEIFNKIRSNERVIYLKSQISKLISDLKSKIYPIFIVDAKSESAIESKSRA